MLGLAARARLGDLRYQVRLWRDLGRVEPLPEHLAASYEEWHDLQQELEPAYRTYIREVSSQRWAASIQLNAFLWHLCKVTEPRTILELGSGFTSYVFRRYAQENGAGVNVVSADSSRDWLDKTAGFLRGVGCTHDGLVLLDDLSATASEATFDLVLNDVLGALRPQLTTEAVRYRAPDGVLVVDDADREPDRWSVLAAARGHGLSVYDLRPWTLDFYGRWALLVAR